MKEALMDLSVQSLALAYLFTIALLVLFKWFGIKREKQIVVATLRMTIQLTLMGYVLMYVFDHPSWWMSLLIVLFMLSVATWNAIKRVKIAMSRKLKEVLCVSLATGYIISAAFFLLAVLCVRPWFDPQYFIPISSMILGGSMTGLALGANSLTKSFRDQRVQIENSLMLGATPWQASHDAVHDAFDSAGLPTMNNMMTMGLVTIPGMMTGQLLSGTFPLTAIKYQMGIMLAILGGIALGVAFFVIFGYRTFFTKADALVPLEHQK